MAENKVLPGPVCGNPSFKEAVCVNTDKIYDSCRDKDCLEDLRVHFSSYDQCIIDKAINVKCKFAEIIWVYIDVEPIPFNRGFFTVDIKFFFRVTLDAFTGVSRPQEVSGLCTFDKKVVLFGSEGSANIFSSQFRPSAQDIQLRTRTNNPQATVECVDPICLGSKVIESCDCNCNTCDCDISALPEYVCCSFEGELVDNGQKVCFVTIGLFSIVRLERKVQLLIPAYDFCLPEKECISSTDDNPCKLFRSMKFPVDEFFPPQIFEFPGLSPIGRDPRDRDCGCK